MLTKMTIENYTTFTHKTVFDFTATNYKSLQEENVASNKVLKGALFVGENASGKTKILLAITFLLDLLFKDADPDFMLRKSFYTKKDNFALSYSFSVDDAAIIYSFTCSETAIVKENLSLNGERLIERLGNTASFTYDGEEKIYSDLSSNLLFLRRLYFDTHFYKNEILNKWYSFLKRSVYINCNTRQIINYDNNVNLGIDEYLKKNSTDKINAFLEKINYGQEIEYSDVFENKDRSYRVNTDSNHKMIGFRKQGTDIYIPMILESSGNHTFVNLLPAFLWAVDNECMIILDEFSSGLHNELEECLIKFFFHYSGNSQLFFTSHSTNILNTKLIRPDQVYSVSFVQGKGSVIHRFSEQSPREAQNIEKMYLNGVFDDLPRYIKKFED